MKKLFTIFAILAMLCAVGCEEQGGDGIFDSSTYDINGAIQKGPFVLGTNITIQPLNNNLKPIGQMYATQTINDAGLFEMDNVNSMYAEIIATGYYFDEVAGNISSTTLTLRSIADLSDGGNVNVNLLTTITYNRVKQLVTYAKQSITDATKQAERELFLALGIPEDKHPKSRCETLDISKEGEGNGLLLAISAILQGGRTVGELSEYIARLSMDLADDGSISENLLDKLVVEGEHLFGLEYKVTNNLQTRYNNIGSDAVIPEFGQYLEYLDPQANYVSITFSYTDPIGDGDGKLLSLVAYDSYEQKVWEYGNGLRDVEFRGVNPIDVIGIYYDNNSADEFGRHLGEIRLSSVPKYIESLNIPATSIVFPEGVEVIGQLHHYYENNWALEEVSFPNSLIAIADRAFAGCIRMQTFQLPDGIKHIGNYAFAGSGIGQIEIPDSVEYIGYGVFAGCVDLSCIISKYSTEDNICLIQNGYLKAVAPMGIIMKSEELHDEEVSYAIPEGVITIGMEAFAWCEYIEAITLPESLTTIESYAFGGCKSLKSVSFPPSLTHIDVGAFFECLSLTDITIPSSITWMGSSVFSGCESLESVTICEGITSIDDDTFNDCKNLTNITIPNSVTSIGYGAFQNCEKLSSITIPENVTSIGQNAFSRCHKLTEIYMLPTTPPEIYHASDYDIAGNYRDYGSLPFNSRMKIYVPRESYDDYMQYSSTLSGQFAQENWYAYESYIEPYDFE